MGPYERRSGAMSVEQRGPAVCSFSGRQEGKDEITKASVNLQDLRRRIYVKAKADTTWRFWGMYVHVCKRETLREAYALAQNNDGAPGSDGVTFAAIEAQGVEGFLERIRDERCVSPPPIAASGSGCAVDQPDTTRLGELWKSASKIGSNTSFWIPSQADSS